MKKIYTVSLLALAYAINISGQDTPEKPEFKPAGSPFAKIYTNAHTQVSESKNETAFEVKRAYFGYEYKMSRHFSGRITLDVGDPAAGKFQHTAYLKYAYMKFSYKNLTTHFGMISTTQFKLQEKKFKKKKVSSKMIKLRLKKG